VFLVADIGKNIFHIHQHHMGKCRMIFQALDFLESFSSAEIDWMMSNAQPVTAIVATTLLQEGTRSDNIYFIIDGLFDVLVCDATGREQRVAQIGPGQIVGEISWFDKQPFAATIRAAENSSVLALPTSMLDHKISSDTAFALNLYRALVRLESQRLKAVGPLIAGLQRSSVSALPPISGVLGTLGEQLAQFMDLVISADKRALEIKSEIPQDMKERVLAEFDLLSKSFSDAVYVSDIPESSRAALGREVQRAILPCIQLTSVTERFYSKPRGYAGDYLSIQMIYDNAPSGVGRIGPVIDACFLSSPAGKAVRNRRGLLRDQIKQQRQMQKGLVRLTSLACGPAQELFDVFTELGVEGFAATGIDIDKEALAVLGDRIKLNRVPICPLHGNLIYLATGRQTLGLPQQDLVYSIGLIDYFNDAFVIKLMDWIFDRLRPGGRVILGNFHPKNPSRAFMDYVLDWRLIHRDESKMDELYCASKFGKPSTRVLFEDEGINLFAECVKD
jgi:extracellular factor (EF) 3-hydroxypalmitic acid methyl ester biosynthesis protein